MIDFVYYIEKKAFYTVFFEGLPETGQIQPCHVLKALVCNICLHLIIRNLVFFILFPLLMCKSAKNVRYCNVFVYPPADERPAGIQDTVLLCPAPVVEEVGRWVSHICIYQYIFIILLAHPGRLLLGCCCACCALLARARR